MTRTSRLNSEQRRSCRSDETPTKNFLELSRATRNSTIFCGNRWVPRKDAQGHSLTTFPKLESYASRPENGYERLERLGEPGPAKVKAKSKAKVGQKQNKAKAGGLHIEFDHRMDIGSPVSSSSHAQEGNKRPVDALAPVPRGEPLPKRQKPMSSRGPSETEGARS